jgi:hypothetical protein
VTQQAHDTPKEQKAAESAGRFQEHDWIRTSDLFRVKVCGIL